MGEPEYSILSIGHAYNLSQVANSSQIRDIWDAVQSTPGVYGEADEYHNYAVESSRKDDNYTAFNIVEMGLKQYPYNTDLLADAILYGSRCCKQERCEIHMATLLGRPMSTWTWRAFSFLIGYLRDRCDWLDDSEEIEQGLHTALEIAQRYQQYYPNEEKSYISEYETRLLLSKFAKDKAKSDDATMHERAAVELLKETINNGKYSAVQCSLRYADIMFEQQEFDEVIRTCKRALEFGEDVTSVRIGYFMYLSAQSKEIQLYLSENLNNADRVNEIYREYTAALAEISPSYRKNIAVRARILEARSGISAPSILINNDK